MIKTPLLLLTWVALSACSFTNSENEMQHEAKVVAKDRHNAASLNLGSESPGADFSNAVVTQVVVYQGEFSAKRVFVKKSQSDALFERITFNVELEPYLIARRNFTDLKHGMEEIFEKLPPGIVTVAAITYDTVLNRNATALKTSSIFPELEAPIHLFFNWNFSEDDSDFYKLPENSAASAGATEEQVPQTDRFIVPYHLSWQAGSEFFEKYVSPVSLGWYSLSKGLESRSLTSSGTTPFFEADFRKFYPIATSPSVAILLGSGSSFEAHALSSKGIVANSKTLHRVEHVRYVTFDTKRNFFLIGGLGSTIYSFAPETRQLTPLVTNVNVDFSGVAYDAEADLYWFVAQPYEQVPRLIPLKYEEVLALASSTFKIPQGFVVPRELDDFSTFYPLAARGGKIHFLAPVTRWLRGVYGQKVFREVRFDTKVQKWEGDLRIFSNNFQPNPVGICMANEAEGSKLSRPEGLEPKPKTRVVVQFHYEAQDGVTLQLKNSELPMHLMLISAEPVNWTVLNATGAKVTGYTMHSLYGNSTVAGLDNIPINKLGLFQMSEFDTIDRLQFEAEVQRVLGEPVSLINVCYNSDIPIEL